MPRAHAREGETWALEGVGVFELDRRVVTIDRPVFVVLSSERDDHYRQGYRHTVLILDPGPGRVLEVFEANSRPWRHDKDNSRRIAQVIPKSKLRGSLPERKVR